MIITLKLVQMIKSIFLFLLPLQLGVVDANSYCRIERMEDQQKRTVIVPNELPFFMYHHHISWSFCEPVIFRKMGLSPLSVYFIFFFFVVRFGFVIYFMESVCVCVLFFSLYSVRYNRTLYFRCEWIYVFVVVRLNENEYKCMFRLHSNGGSGK